MRDDKASYVPTLLDDKWKIAWWDAEVAIPFLFFAFMAVAGEGFLWRFVCLALAVLSSYMVTRLKSGRHPFYFIHSLRWYFPTNLLALRRMPPPEEKGFLG